MRVAAMVLSALAGASLALGKPAHPEAAALIEAHNRVRARHCAPPLSWSARLATSAQRWADTLRARGCSLSHSGGDHGENLAAGTTGMLNAATVVRMWYDELKHYSFGSGGFSMRSGHFTQLVWRGTKQLGCGHASCKDLDVWVCQYSPPGNVQGQFRQNVSPPNCR